MNARRMIASVGAVVLVAGGLAMASAPAASARPAPVGTVTDNANGTATVTYAGLADSSGIFLCPGTGAALDCSYDVATFGLVTLLSNLGPSPVTISAGMAVALSGGETVQLPAGTYAIALVDDYGPGRENNVVAGASSVRIYAGEAKNLTLWTKQTARASADDACTAGYSPSWAQWPNGGNGGWVCTMDTYAYYPGETVR